jgi:DivIVA domain-containing protein
VEAARLAWEREHPSADERRDSLLVTRPGRYDRLVTGGKIRDTTFLTGGLGYDIAQVDDLLRRVAEELDAGRPVEPLIRSAIFQMAADGYDIGAVDWFLGQLLLRPRLSEPAELSADPWRGLGVTAQFTRSGASNSAQRSARQSRRTPDRYYAEECWEAWHEFDKQPGMYLRLGWVGISRRELLTMEMQTIASMRGRMSETMGWPPSQQRITISIGGKSFTFKKTRFHQSPSPDMAQIITRSSRDFDGHFAANMRDDLGWRVLDVKELVDEAGIPVLYTSGNHWNRSAHASISFPGQRWLRFPVRGIRRLEAIMTAVDEAGNSVVRYRIIPQSSLRRGIVEITVHPGWELTDELVLAIAISAPWLNSYFLEPSGGG